jgi:transcriptional regulator with XRE-family HTH domain
MSLREKLRIRRAELDISQADLAAILNVHHPQVSLWEAGHYPRSHNLKKINSFLTLDPKAVAVYMRLKHAKRSD